MGYAVTIPNVVVEYAGNVMGGAQVITTVATDISLSDIVLPSTIIGSIEHAYIDVMFSTVSDSSGVENKVDGNQYIQIAINSDYAHPHNAILLPNHSLVVPANSAYAYGRIFGDIDIASYVSPGCTINVFWASSKSDGNALRVYHGQAVVRMILGIG